MRAAMHLFRRPGLWLGLWLVAVGMVIALSLLPPPPMPELPSGSDKVEHFLAYFALSAGAVQLFRTPRAWLACALGLVALGVGLEIAQGALTATRMQDPFDALANALGVLVGLSTALTPWRQLLLRLESRV